MGVQMGREWDRAEVLERLGGDEELLAEVMEIFLSESPKLVEKLRKAVGEGDCVSVMQAAHSIKGEVSYLGAAGALEAASQLEDMGREKNLLRAADTLAVLERDLHELYFAMRDAAGTLP